MSVQTEGAEELYEQPHVMAEVYGEQMAAAVTDMQRMIVPGATYTVVLLDAMLQVHEGYPSEDGRVIFARKLDRVLNAMGYQLLELFWHAIRSKNGIACKHYCSDYIKGPVWL